MARTLPRAALLVAAALVAGCAQPPTKPVDSHALVTASDETNASKRARVRMELASGYFAQGQTNEALDNVKQALAADPSLPSAYNLRGLIYAAMGEQALAEESFQRSLQLAPHDPDTLHNFGWYRCQQRRFGDAQALFTQALAVPQYRDAPRTLLAEGVCQANAGQWADAEQSLSRAFELDPANPSVSVNLAEVLYQRGELERARFYVRRVNSREDQSTAQTLWLAARIEKRAGNGTALAEVGKQLRNRFPQSREAAAFERAQFDE